MRRSPILAILVLSLLLGGLSACGSDAKPAVASDGDSEDELELAEVEEESGSEVEPDAESCVESGCTGGRVCDVADGLCKDCAKNGDCGVADPVTGVTPSCRGGRCMDLVCGALYDPLLPAKGAGLGTGTLSPGFDERGLLVPSTKAVFVIGALALSPSRYAEAKEAGFNLALSARPCCSLSEDLTYQSDTVLTGAHQADLFAGVFAAWPKEALPVSATLDFLNGLSARSQRGAHLLWLGGDFASGATPDGAFASALRGLIREAGGNTKPIAYAAAYGADFTAIAPYGDVFIVALENAASLKDDIARYKRQVGTKPIWARFSAADAQASTLALMAQAAIAYGAGGVIFDFANEASPGVPAFASVAQAATTLYSRAPIWLAPEDSFLEIDSLPGTVAVLQRFVDGKAHVALFVNLGNDSQIIALRAKPLATPYCRAVRDQDHALFLSEDPAFSVTVPAQGVLEIQVTEAVSPGAR